MIYIPHYNSYDSFKIKKSVDKKNNAKEKSLRKSFENNDFIVKEAKDYGIVIEVKYNEVYVLYHDEVILTRLKKELNMVCNQILFPGDKVVLDDSNNIVHLVKRTTLLSRVKKDGTRLEESKGLTKNIAANINLAVIVVSAKEPPLHPKFIDRYLMILQNSEIEVIICFNKCDLKTDKEEQILNIYRKLGIPVIETSTYQNIGLEELKTYLKGKQSIFVGNSGVGKSSLTNAIMGDEDIKTGHISEKSKRGCHTTTTSKYYIWDDESSIIDTPGIRSLDISSFKPNEIQDYFSEFNHWKEQCKYKDCLHYNEPYDSCIIKQAVANSFINQERYESYLRIISSLLKDNDYEQILKQIREDQ